MRPGAYPRVKPCVPSSPAPARTSAGLPRYAVPALNTRGHRAPAVAGSTARILPARTTLVRRRMAELLTAPLPMRPDQEAGGESGSYRYTAAHRRRELCLQRGQKGTS